MSKKRAPAIFVIILIVIIAAAALIYYFLGGGFSSRKHMDAADYFGNAADGEAAIVSTEGLSDKKALISNGITYIDYDTVHNYINDKFYLDTTENILTVTTPTEKVQTDITTADASVIMISSGDEVDSGDTAGESPEGAADNSGQEAADNVTGESTQDAETGKLVYISLDYIRQYSDIEVNELSDPARLVIRDRWDLENATVNKDAPIRFEESKKSVIIKDAAAGDTLTVISRGTDFARVMTSDGFVGYISNDVLTISDPASHESSLGEYTSLSFDGKINMVFHQTDSQDANSYLAKSLEGVSGVNVIAPTWFFIDDTSGNLTDLTSSDYVNTAHAAGLKVFAVLNDFDGGISSRDETGAVLSSTSARNKIISFVISSVQNAGADGVNVDIENVNENSSEAFNEFLRELSVECRNAGLYLSVDTYVPQPYNTFYDREAFAEVCDYVVTMAYDEHTSGSEEAGSVSSISWVQQALSDAGTVVPAEKTVIAIPFYTRVWTTDKSGGITSSAMGMSEAENYVSEHSMLRSWDDKLKQNYAVLESSGEKTEIWLEDGESISAKMEEITSANAAGVAEWKLGLQSSDIWQVISEYLSQ